jgi:hypothetical protein
MGAVEIARKWSDSGYILKILTAVYSGISNKGYERK